MTPAADATSVAALLAELGNVLAEELDAIASHDALRLEQAVARKTVLVGALEQAGAAMHERPAPRTAAWQEVRRLAADCQTANRVNGGAVALNRALVERLVALARGAPAGAATYTAHGRMHAGTAARGVARV